MPMGKDQSPASLNMNKYTSLPSTPSKTIEKKFFSKSLNNLTTVDAMIGKNVSLKAIIPNFGEIPSYLTGENGYLRQLIRKAFPFIEIINNNDHIENFRKIAIVIYKIKLIQMYHDLWTTYLKSGTGQLFNNMKKVGDYSLNVSIWPKEIQQQIKSWTTIYETDFNVVYLKFVQSNLYELNYYLNYYQSILTINANMLKNYSSDLQKLIENYIEDHLCLLRMSIEHQIELVHYDYHIKAIKMELMCQHPTSSQQQLMEDICEAKIDQVTTEQTYLLIQKQIEYFKSSNSLLQYPSLAAFDMIGSSEDPGIQSQLLTLDAEIASIEMAIYEIQYEIKMDKLRETCSTFSNNNPSYSLMMALIEQCCLKIAERIQCIYRYKTQCIETRTHI